MEYIEPDWMKAHKQKKATGNPNWKPGGPSPNPAGRPRGIVDKRTRVTQALMDDAHAVARVVIDAALAGDVQAAGLVLSRVAPAIKAQAERVTFTFDSKADQITQVEAVIQAIADGHVSVDTGKQIVEAIAALSGVRQVENLRARIEALEKLT